MRRLAYPLLIVLGVVVFFCWLLTTRKRHDVQPQSKTTTYPMTFIDITGKPVTLAHRPMRIISLAPAVTETLFAVGAGNRVIADTIYCKYPTAAVSLPKIGDYSNPDAEKIVAFKPDLVFGEKGNALNTLQYLSQLGIPVLTVDPISLEEVENTIRLIGRATGDSETAEKLATQCSQRREAVANRIRALAPATCPRTLLLLSQDGLFSAGPGSFIDEMIRLAGGVNVAGNSKIPWPELSMESVISANPEIVIVLSGSGMTSALTPNTALARFRADMRWRLIAAIKAGRVAILDEDELTLPGPRLIDGLEAMVNAIHPKVK